MYRTIIPKVTMVGIMSLLIVLTNAMDEIETGHDQVNCGIDASLSQVEINYHKYADVAEAQKKMTCRKGYDVCCAVSNQTCGCFKFKNTFKSHFMLKNADSAYFGSGKYGDIELECKKAEYAIEESLFELFHRDKLYESLEEIPKTEKTHSYCGLIGNDLQKQHFIRFYALHYQCTTKEEKYEIPQQMNEEISISYAFCGTKEEVEKTIQEQSPKILSDTKEKVGNPIEEQLNKEQKLYNAQVKDQLLTQKEFKKGGRSHVQADTLGFKKPNTWIFIGVFVFGVGALCYFGWFNASTDEEMIQIIPVAHNSRNYFPSETDLVIEVMESITEQSTDEETTQCSLSVEHSTTPAISVSDLTTEFKTQSSELNEQSKSEEVPSLQFSAEVSSLQFSEDKPSVESMKFESESEDKPEKPISQFPTKEQEKKQENF